ncbi:43kDa postsynaptic [Olea europaea subsp. europaea]|uniref:43kDa postsynaptic n=1 Tax=Olea europaea subsp. europaea TaxID=158383 RepID=A0A8S0QMC6_OLEEU|nr:43kDa postsynaptic [Olea europaea subsp. europaea]
MGSACCVAARDRTITSQTPSEALQWRVRHSPSWSFLLDNRGRVAGEEMSTNILLNEGGGNDRLDVKSATTAETAFASEEGSSLDSFRSLACRKSPVSDGNGGNLRFPSSDPPVSRKTIELNEPAESAAVSSPSPVKLSPSAPSVSPVLTSPLSSHSHMLPPKSTPSRWSPHSPGQQLLRQVSDSPITEYKSRTFSISEEASSFVLPTWGYESTKGSNGGSSDGWSIPPFSELMMNRKERWSFDSENSGFSRDKITRSAGRNSGSPSFDLQSCGVCAKLLTERSLLGSQKIIATNELGVVAVLTCGHAYHAECLEYMTPEINKYDPACPVCTFGEKQTMKMSEKAIKAELDSKARKRSRNRVVDSDDLILFDHHKCHEIQGSGPKMSSSSSMKSSSGMPFLRRHFSFGTKGHKSLSDNYSTRRKGFFWSKSSKE